MRIAFVTSQYFPTMSGVGYYIKQLGESLVKLGHNITVYTPGSEHLRKTEVINGVAVKRFLPSARLFRGYQTYPEMKPALIRDSPDLIHSHHYGYYPCVAGLAAAKSLGIPHIITPVLHPPKFSPVRTFLFSMYHHLYGKRVLRESDCVLALSKHEITELVRLGVKKSRMHVVYNPVSGMFRPKKTRRENVIMFVGPLGETKGADVAFTIMKNIAEKLPGVRFLFVGKGPIEEKIKSEPEHIRKMFFFKSRISGRELAKWYSRAALLLSPTPYEAFGRAIAEAQACGTPVVATNVGSLPELVKNGKSGFLVKYGSWDEMERKVLELLRNPKKSRAMGNYAAKSMKRFSEEAFVKKHIAIYTSLKA